MKVLTHYIAWTLGLVDAETQTTPAECDCLARHARGRRHVVDGIPNGRGVAAQTGADAARNHAPVDFVFIDGVTVLRRAA